MKLQFDPFDSSNKAQDFFSGANRQELLDALLEQSSYASNVLIVTGKLGTGKTMLAQCYIDSLDNHFETVRIEATLFMEPEQLLDSICAALQLVRDQFITADELLERIDSYAESLGQRGKTLQLVIDDAHELSADSLNALLMLLEQQRDKSGLGEDGIKLALFGEPQLLDIAAELLSDNLVCYELTELDTDDFLDYVEFRLASMGRSGKMVVTDDLLESMYQESAGIPAAIDAILAREAEALPVTGRLMPGLSFPERHLVAASALFGALVLLLFIMTGEDEPQISEPVAVETQPVADPTPAQVQIPVAIEIPRRDVPRFEPVNSDSGAQPVADQLLADAPLANRTAEFEPQVSEEIPEAEVATADASIQDNEVSDPAPMPPENVVIGAAGRIEFPEPVEASAVEPVEVETVVSAQQQVPETQPDNTEVVVPEVVSQPVEQPTEMLDEEIDLLALSPSQYSLQLLGSRSEENVQNFIAQHQDSELLTYFETRHEGRPWYVVIYGTLS